MANKYGIPSLLSNGKRNPAYQRAVYYAHGGHPKKKAGNNKYGTPSHLPNGKTNPEYSKIKYDAKLLSQGKTRGRQPSKYGVQRCITLPDGRKVSNPAYTKARYEANRTRRGRKPRRQSKYGVPSHLPNGRLNPEYLRIRSQDPKIKERARVKELQRSRERGVKPRSRKYGVPYYLPDGSINPEWRLRQSRAKGHKPRSQKYGIPSTLPDGSKNPAYYLAWNRAHGIKPRSLKYGIHEVLPDGSRNPDYVKTRRRAIGAKPRPSNWGNKYGVPPRLPNGERNPEYAKALRESNPDYKIMTRKWWKSPEGQAWYEAYKKTPEYEEQKKRKREWAKTPEGRHYFKHWRNSPRGQEFIIERLHRRKRDLPTTIILGRKFKGSHLHHMTPDIGIYIPEKTHRQIWHCLRTGKNMDKINALAWAYYAPEDPWHTEILPVSNIIGRSYG